MVHTLTVLTLWLAQAIGLYLVAVGIGIVAAPARIAGVVEEMERSPGLCMAFGVAAYAIGVAILIPHHVLYDPLSIVVTLIAMLAAIEGLLLLALPAAMIAVSRAILSSVRLWGIVAIVLGLVLFLCGFTGRADALP